MLVGQIRLDTLRYTARTGDIITQSYQIQDSDLIFYKTQHRNTLVCRKEKYDCDGENRDKGKEFEMVIAIKNKNGKLISGKDIENAINKENANAIADLLTYIDSYLVSFKDKEVLDKIADIQNRYAMFEL